MRTAMLRAVNPSAPMEQSAASGDHATPRAREPRMVGDVLRTSGAPLDAASRSFFEPRFHYDFTRIPVTAPQRLPIGAPDDAFELEARRLENRIDVTPGEEAPGTSLEHVRVHTGPDAAASARSLGARAFTVGAHIVFGENEYTPGTTGGRRLIAHELAHVQQQATHGMRIQRAETDDDPAHVPCDDTLADGMTKLNAEINGRLETARKKAALAGGKPLQVVEAARQGLTATKWYSDVYTTIENWAENNLPASGGGWPSLGLSPWSPFGGVTVRDASSGTRYQGTSRMAEQAHMAPVVKLNGICCGTDKIGHFFQQGYQYYRITQPEIIGGFGQSADVAEAWGESMEGRIGAKRSASARAWVSAAAAKPEDSAEILGQKEGDYGLAKTGVFSNADLAANRAGLQFWKDLSLTPSLKFDIATYITKDWNESVAGNVYAPDIAKRVRINRGKLGKNDEEVAK
jgi:hypothetical protein